jgi:hypothetical protein
MGVQIHSVINNREEFAGNIMQGLRGMNQARIFRQSK